MYGEFAHFFDTKRLKKSYIKSEEGNFWRKQRGGDENHKRFFKKQPIKIKKNRKRRVN